ncbi:hypothetical protein E1B28_001749 [Marasmius oreades]|uniref:MOSC domain-containing protein n=1 Tax=Marasmius oreades TaxID=181124 RepID=A0A9P8AFH7_9AGAR|nr:uncharacterized protein E1B28_001749 [Marasmius oreades]KAG7099956.1 hypothetical protein E1B28_001749 [Marasmius oreades]
MRPTSQTPAPPRNIGKPEVDDSERRGFNHTTEEVESVAESTGHDVDVRVSKLLVHPIKSCRGTSVQSSRYTSEGLEFDRQWCVIEADTHKIITAREFPTMVLITPTIEENGGSPYGGTLKISFPEGSGCRSLSVPLRPNAGLLKNWGILHDADLMGRLAIDGYICQEMPDAEKDTSNTVSETFSAYFRRPVHLVQKGSSPRPCLPSTNYPDFNATALYQDMYPLLILSEESMAEVDREVRSRVGTQQIDECWKTDKVAIERFRPNIVLKGGGPWVEDQWTEVSIGTKIEVAKNAPSILIVGKCVRCTLPNVSPETGEKDKSVPLKVLMKFRLGLDPNRKYSACVGTWGAPLQEGVVKVGDRVFVRKKLTE